MLLEAHLEALGSAAIAEALDLDAPAIVRPTQDAKFGDYQLNGVLALAKREGKNPRELAAPVIEKLLVTPAIASAQIAGPGFINLTLDEDWIATELTRALRDADRKGVPLIAEQKKIVIDFSSPNIAKQMHVGHLRSTIIGDAISRLLRFVGHEITRDNHLGDWGTQFGLLIVGMRQWGDEAALEREPIVELERVYKLAADKAKDDDDFAAAARQELAKLQNGDAENRALWERFVNASRHVLEAVYAKLDVSFDTWRGESAYHAALPEVVADLLARKIAREDEGAVCVFWNELDASPKKLKKQKTPFIIRKQDGAFLYSTTDIATVLYRRDQLKADAAVYVVDHRQSLHFQQLFALMEILGIEMELAHVGFGTVLGQDGKPLRTRDAKGNAITLSALLLEAEERARERIQSATEEGKLRVPEKDIDRVATIIGIGAVKYADLRQNRLSDYQFDWDKMITFSGNAGPYLQYAYARCQSVFAKGGLKEEEVAQKETIAISEAQEIELAKRLLKFSDAVHKAAETYQPHLLCEHLYELARAFSSFYTACPILNAEGETRSARLALTALTAAQLRHGLNLIGIQVVDQM